MKFQINIVRGYMYHIVAKQWLICKDILLSKYLFLPEVCFRCEKIVITLRSLFKSLYKVIDWLQIKFQYYQTQIQFLLLF